MPQIERRIPDKLQTRAEVGSFNADANTIEVTFATERPVRSWDWDNWQPFNEVLAVAPSNVRMERLERGAPFLKDHRATLDNTIGTVTRAWIEKGTAKAEVRLSGNPEHAGIIADLRDGVFRNVSVGYKVHKYEKQPRTENDTIDTYRAVDWEPLEISLVSIPADPTAQVRAESADVQYRSVYITNEEDKPMSNPTNPTPPAPVIDEARVRAEAAKAERERAAAIQHATRAAGLGEEFAQQHIENATDIEQVRKLIIDELAKRTHREPSANPSASTLTTKVGTDRSAEAFRRDAQNGLMLRAGVNPRTPLNDDDRRGAEQFRGKRLMRLAEDCLRRLGVATDHMGDMEIVARAFTTSTSDFPVILGGVIHQTLLGAYETTPDTWSQFCAIGTVTDFRPHERLRMGSFGRLDKLTENGQYRNKPITDANKETIQAQTFGNIINITRKMIINDDLDAFSRLPAMLGRAAKYSIELDVYKLLTDADTKTGDGTALFHSTHGNLAGSGAAPSVAALDAIRVAMAKQQDKDKNYYLNNRPSIIVCPIELGGTFRTLNEAQYEYEASSQFQKPNKVRGLFSKIVDTPQLGGTAYYAFADPSIMPVLEVAFLNGVQTPFMEMQEGFDSDGIEWKVRLDYGVGAVDFRGAYKQPGA